jgi:hypothetical protein
VSAIAKAKAGSKKIFFDGQREILSQDKVGNRRNTWCISRFSKRSIAGKEPLLRQKDFLKARQK